MSNLETLTRQLIERESLILMRFLLNTTLMATLVGISTSVIGATNLLRNPGFEDWQNESLPRNWAVEAVSLTRVLRETDTVSSGSSSGRFIRLVAGTGNNRGVSQHILINGDRQYRYSVRCFDNTPGIALGVFITWRTADSGFIRSEPVIQSRDASEWQTLTDTVTAPANAARAEFVVRTYGESGSPAGLRVFADDAFLGFTSSPPETTRIWFSPDSLAARLCDFLDRATVSIDYCHYNSSRPDVVLKLISRHQAGVRVRVITDNSRLNDQWVAYLRGSGITVWTDSIGPNSSAYMHNKFALVDLADSDTSNDWVWVASYNPNSGEVFADCALEIPSSALARAYLAEFNQMWGSAGAIPRPDSARFHSAKRNVLPSREFTVDGFPARLYFGPQDRPVDTITTLAGTASQELIFAIFSYTWQPLAEAMVAARNRGAVVAGLFDRSSPNDPNSVFRYLRSQHLPVVYDSTITIHEKLMVIDSSVCITGSTNWSNNANSANDENTLAIFSPTIINRLHSEIVRRYLAAGGTWPPAIEEDRGDLWYSVRPLIVFTRCGQIPPSLILHDATGRKTSSNHLSPGVYFSQNPAVRVLVVP